MQTYKKDRKRKDVHQKLIPWKPEPIYDNSIELNERVLHDLTIKNWQARMIRSCKQLGLGKPSGKCKRCELVLAGYPKYTRYDNWIVCDLKTKYDDYGMPYEDEFNKPTCHVYCLFCYWWMNREAKRTDRFEIACWWPLDGPRLWSGLDLNEWVI